MLACNQYAGTVCYLETTEQRVLQQNGWRCGAGLLALLCNRQQISCNPHAELVVPHSMKYVMGVVGRDAYGQYIVTLRAHDNCIVVVLQLSSCCLHIISGAFT